MIDYEPDYIRDRLETTNLERSPETDDFDSDYKLNKFVGASKMKIPSGTQVVETITLVGTILNVLNDAIKSGRNVYETLVDWIGTNDKLSDKDKVKAMQIGSIIAKQSNPRLDEAA